MARVIVESCDICGIVEKKENQHWTGVFGKVLLSFKNIAALQCDLSQELLCPNCARQIKEAIEKEITRIKDTK